MPETSEPARQHYEVVARQIYRRDPRQLRNERSETFDLRVREPHAGEVEPARTFVASRLELPYRDGDTSLCHTERLAEPCQACANLRARPSQLRKSLPALR